MNRQVRKIISLVVIVLMLMSAVPMTSFAMCDIYGHTLVDFPAVMPSCDVNGMNAGKKCIICGEVVSGGEVIVSSGHDYKQVSFSAGSCKDKTPTVEVKRCRICGETRTETKPAECEFGKWITESMPTCSVAGKMTKTCSECGAKEERIIDKTPHIEIVVTAKPATCTDPGNTAGKKCIVCNAITQGCEIIPASHQADWEIVSDSTCTATGERKGFCYICEKNVVEKTPMKDHEFKYISGQPSSCYNNGWELLRCSYCGFELKRTLYAQCNWSSWITVSMPTCSVTGMMTRSCRDCGAKEEKYIDNTPHTEVVVIAVEATCDTAGKTAGKKCTVCNTITQGCETIPELGHREEIVAGYPATCGKKGLTDGSYCKVCNKVLRPQVEIVALDHIIEIDKSASKNPTCTAEGLRVEKCVRLGCDYNFTKIIPITHYANWIVDKIATCTEEGQKSGYCTKCNQTVVEIIPVKEHIVTNALSWRITVAPTCIKDGVRVALCSVCHGEVSESVPATGHNEKIVTPAIEATCTQNGRTAETKCANCNIDMQKAIPVEPIGHIYIKDDIKSFDSTCTIEGRFYGKCKLCGDIKDEIVDVAEHKYLPSEQIVANPTCTQTGVSIKICKDCFNIQTNTLPVIGHTDVDFDGKCDLCGFAGNFVPTDSCTCNCHKTGIANIFFKLMLFFQKLFRVNRVCKCGVAHY